jgi:peptidoglycan hydrolase-like protein with peptidoglycan-binding domain
MNQTQPATFDVAPWQGTELLLSAVAVECRRDPKGTFHTAAYRVTTGLQEGRVREKSPLVTARVGDQSVVLYAEVVNRLQRRLAGRRLLATPPSGQFDAATIAAVKAFQREQQLAVTGLPDQITLGRLLLPVER